MTIRNNFLNILTGITVALLLTTFPSYAQDNDPPSKFWENVQFGGNFGFGFGNNFTAITVSPNAIYRFNNKFGAGIGINASYTNQSNIASSWVTGGSVIGLYSPIREIQLSAEFEELHVSRNFEARTGIADQSYWYPAFFVGAGYQTRFVTIGIRYDLLYDEDKSIYSNAYVPFIRLSF